MFGIRAQASDFRKLGRWSYYIVEGKNHLKTLFLTCYCPVRSSNPGSAYSQQLVYMNSHRDLFPNEFQCPRQLFGYDLGNLIQEFYDEGTQLCIMGDFNSDYDSVLQWMDQYDLTDAIAARHGPCPVTYNRSNNHPLDMIFLSPHLSSHNNGFLRFGYLAGDHRGIWLDIPTFLILGHNPPQSTHPDTRRLKLKDPRIVARYLEYLMFHYEDEDVFQST